MNEKLSAEALSALLGQFTPENLGSRLFMERSDLLTPENFLVWFHERFHYLQVACEFETLDEAWVAAEEYAEMSDLTMAEEMKADIIKSQVARSSI